jgi:hypothetical protein
MERKWRARLSAVEREKFDQLDNYNDREAFRILHNWAKADSPDFKIHCRTLSDRICVTLRPHGTCVAVFVG